MRISDWSSDVCSSDLLRRLHMLKRGHGVVRSAPGDYRVTSRSLLDADFYDAIMFLNGHGGAFPRGATGYKRSAVFGDLPVYKGPKSVRSEERRVGKECGSTCSSLWWPSSYTKNRLQLIVSNIYNFI